MNRTEAEAGAARIWPKRGAEVEPKPFHRGAWYVRLDGDQGVHMLDTDGKPDCHAACSPIEAL